MGRGAKSGLLAYELEKKLRAWCLVQRTFRLRLSARTIFLVHCGFFSQKHPLAPALTRQGARDPGFASLQLIKAPSDFLGGCTALTEPARRAGGDVGRASGAPRHTEARVCVG